MDYEHIEGPDGLDIRVPTNNDYRTCTVCGGDCEPDTTLSSDSTGVRIVWMCPEHGPQGIVDPFEDRR